MTQYTSLPPEDGNPQELFDRAEAARDYHDKCELMLDALCSVGVTLYDVDEQLQEGDIKKMTPQFAHGFYQHLRAIFKMEQPPANVYPNNVPRRNRCKWYGRLLRHGT